MEEAALFVLIDEERQTAQQCIGLHLVAGSMGGESSECRVISFGKILDVIIDMTVQIQLSFRNILCHQ